MGVLLQVKKFVSDLDQITWAHRHFDPRHSKLLLSPRDPMMVQEFKQKDNPQYPQFSVAVHLDRIGDLSLILLAVDLNLNHRFQVLIISDQTLTPHLLPERLNLWLSDSTQQAIATVQSVS